MSVNPLNDLAVIIPVGPNETAWRSLLPELAQLPNESEIILVGVDSEPLDFRRTIGQNVRWVTSARGRAKQLNRGVQASTKRNLWFLHADSRIEKRALVALERSLRQNEVALHYFDLCFLDDGPWLMRLNNFGVWIRSHGMRLPFGDQGLCIPRHLLAKLGGFDERVPFGEDHLLVWAAHQNGIPVRCTGATIQTSARRYGEGGWSKTTARTMFLTARQALPELMKLMRKRVAHARS